MKKIITGLLLVTMLCTVVFMGTFADTTTTAVATTTPKVIAVNGVGEITVTPDIAYISVGVQTKNEDAKIAQNENKVAMDKIMKALKAAKIETKDLQTSNYSIHRSFDYSIPVKNEEERVQLFFVSNTLNVTIRDIDEVGAIIDAAAEAGANNFNSIRFGTTKGDTLYLEALKLAMTSAKNKADVLSGTFGVKLGAPAKVNESGYNQGAVSRNADVMFSMAEAKMSTPVQAGELTITANVQVEYNY